MTVPVHSALGILVAFISPFHWLATATLAYLSHYVLDACEHWEKDYSPLLQGNKRRLQIASLVEVLLAAGLYCLVWRKGWDGFPVLASAIAASLPDIKHLHPAFFWFSFNGWHEKVHNYWQGNPTHRNEGPPVFQTAFIVIFIFFILTRG